MKAIASCQCLDPMPAVAHWLHYADAAKAVVEKKTRIAKQTKLTLWWKRTLSPSNNIKTHPFCCGGSAQQRAAPARRVYDIESGEIRTLDNTKSFVSSADNPGVYFE